MQPKVKKNWINALCDGRKYRQYRGGLRGEGNLRCAGGVLTDLFIFSSAGRNANASWCGMLYVSEIEDHEKLVVPLEVVRWAGLPSSNPILGTYGDLQTLNDVKMMKFREIADLIDLYL